MHPAIRIANALEVIAQDLQYNLPEAWARLLRLHPGSPQVGLAMFNHLRELQEVQQEILASPALSQKAKNLYGNAAAQLEPYISPFTASSHPVSQLAKLADKIDLLHLAGDALPVQLVPKIEPATLKELILELTEIGEKIPGSTLADPLKRLMQSSIDTLLFVLINYELIGPDGAARIYGGVAAGLARASQDLPKKDAAQPLLRRLLSTTKKMGAAVVFAGAVVSGAHELIEDGTAIIEMLEGSPSAAASDSSETPPGVGGEV